MKSLYFLLCFTIGYILSQEELLTEINEDLYFYDLRLKDGFRRPILDRIPCRCSELTCGCCAGMKVQTFNFDRKACMNFTYDPLEFSLTTNMLMNDETIFEQTISAKNPPPACMPVPIPFLSSVDFCVRLYDIYTPGVNLHMCLDFLARLARAPLVVLHFNCLQIGRDGVHYLRPEDTLITSTVSPPIFENNTTEAEAGSDEFDPVTEIQRNVTDNSL